MCTPQLPVYTTAATTETETHTQINKVGPETDPAPEVTVAKVEPVH